MGWPMSTGPSKNSGLPRRYPGDQAMMDAYRSGDPYLAFGKQAGAIPPNATKLHPKRELFKQCVLAVNTGWRPKPWRPG